MGRAGHLTLADQSKLDVMRQTGSSLHEMSRHVKKSRSSIRRYLSDPVNYGQKHKEYSGRKERLVSVIKETSSEPLPTLRKVSTKSRRRLDSMSAFFVFFFRNRRRSHTFQQDNAAINSSNFTKNYRQQYNNIQAFKTAVQREWDSISVDEPKKLVATRPNRVVEVIQKNCGETSR
uniref:HTH_Tnp_Tc3_1 domain-containing protein n=1 Tax=Caenorhabditis japonica TaxID=281687 RepID=A0A8R1EEC0_CAEJA